MKEKLTVIIDYNLGNLFSVKHACDHVGLNTVTSNDIDLIKKADALILPGVGAFGEAMNNIDQLNIRDAIIERTQAGIPLLGVCLGLQLLFDESEEFGHQKGLGLLAGKVKKLPGRSSDGKKFKVPQIAWNSIHATENLWEKSALNSVKDGEYFYFVHSYYVAPENDSEILCTTQYAGMKYCSGVMKNNIIAFQFHPEKSGEKGISIYRNWAEQNDLL
ncbi:MAG: imidazole glycerol phosphate synthase subunit HisH [Crocinitomicaceae bacterium]|nr:imidazole glycerol phosphate synthase subunit HisH [Crocinitomicaceae bacterium]|tara:strand:+ start:5436 stop:6089 length:654 start_codon:yes stop_codon:yes gene_type:complete